MGYQFSNNWPYLGTGFPSMDDHVDPVNNAYFSGLHEEIEKIEYYLGIHPQGSSKDVAERLAGFQFSIGDNYASLVSIIQTNYDFLYLRDDTYNDAIWNALHPDVAEDFNDVKDKLETHGHTGGTDGIELTYPVPGVWQGIGFVGSPGWFTVEHYNVGTSYAGFAYYNFVYLGPCLPNGGTHKIRSFNTLNDEHFWEESIVALIPRGAVWTGVYGIFAMGGTPGHILRFNPLTWEQIDTTLDSGDDFPNHLCEQDTNVWIPTTTSPARIVRYTPSTHAHASWTMDAGENECKAICTDGTYIWTCCNTNPVKLIRFKISDKTHTTFTLTGFLPEVIYMAYIGGMIYMFSSNATIQWARFNPTFTAFQKFTPDFPYPFKSGTIWENKLALMLSDGTNAYMTIFKPSALAFWLSSPIGAVGPATWLTIANNHAVWPGDSIDNIDWEAPITDPTW